VTCLEMKDEYLIFPQFKDWNLRTGLISWLADVL
jgi:hypothetical protein